MIQCDRCYCWQHGICVGIKSQEACPDFYLCTECQDQELVTLATSMPQSQRSGTRSRRPSGGNQNEDATSSSSSVSPSVNETSHTNGSRGNNGNNATTANGATSNSTSNGTSSGNGRSRRSREPESQSSKRNNSHSTNGRSRRQRSSDDEPASRRDVETASAAISTSSTNAATTTTATKSDEITSTTTSRRKRKTDISDDGDDLDDTSMDETNQQRPKKKVNSDQSGDDVKVKPSSTGSINNKNDFDMDVDTSPEYTPAPTNDANASQADSCNDSPDTSVTASNAHLSTPKRARRNQRSGNVKAEGHGSSTSGSTTTQSGVNTTITSTISVHSIPSYRPRVWTGRTSIEDLRRRAQQIEGYIRRLQQDMDPHMSQESSYFSQTPLSGSVAQSPSDTLLQNTTMVASPESSIHDETMTSRAATPDAITMSLVDMELLEGIETLLTQPSAEAVDTKFEKFPYSCLLEGVRRTAVAFLDRHNVQQS
ncbi:hypothetical protein BDF22DRAFT_375292 [Syncephalis plumigaleata]|nr:hypothetical protein BDF22DRAFT_375292 [Syncephalis plumigaleata]